MIKLVKESIMAEIMTTQEIAKYLKLHEITICKLAAEGKIPAVRIGRVWRFDKNAVDEWIAKGQSTDQPVKKAKAKATSKTEKKKSVKKKKSIKK
jgi:excisionase family DNA binding protein